MAKKLRRKKGVKNKKHISSEQKELKNQIPEEEPDAVAETAEMTEEIQTETVSEASEDKAEPETAEEADPAESAEMPAAPIEEEPEPETPAEAEESAASREVAFADNEADNTMQIPEKEESEQETVQEEPVSVPEEPEEPAKEVSVFMEPPHWIHHTKTDESVVGGIIYLPQCDCSVCGFTVNMEKKICPHCGSKME